MRFSFLYPAVLLAASTSQLALGQKAPAFKSYPVIEYYRGLQTAPKIKSTADAWTYRTRIRRIARLKPNFAGHYSIGTWGCGSSCFHFAIVDVRNGTVYYHHSQDCSAFTTYRDIPKPIDFRVDSRLLILDCGDSDNNPHYFKLERGKLVAIR